MASYPPYDPAAYQQPAAYPPAADPNAAYYAAPPPAYAAAPPPYAYQPHPDEVRTLFITGFPEDVKERELNNLLRFLPAYEVTAWLVHHVLRSQSLHRVLGTRARIRRRGTHPCHHHFMSQASQMHHKNGMAQGFALFQNGAAARAAVDSLHNMV